MSSILVSSPSTGALAPVALAHIGVEQSNSFAAGISHPLNGIDHIIVMVAVGLWAVLVGGRAIWVLPMAFVGTMLAGFAAAILGLQLPLVEPAILSSVMSLSLLLALRKKAPVWLGAATVGLFGFFHGHAHGLEATFASLIPYAAGFSLATAGLHATGITLGLFAKATTEKIALGDGSESGNQRCSR
jgi:urease accessory protein